MKRTIKDTVLLLCNPFEWGPLLRFQQRARNRYYDRCLHDRKFAQRTLASYLPLSVLQGKGTALDVGCGDGRMTALFRQLGYFAVGLDLRPSPLWSRHRHRNFIVGSAESLPFADRSADLCVSFLALGYVADDRRAVQEIARVLKSRGTLLLQLTNKNNLYSVVHRKLLDPQHLREYTLPEIERLLHPHFAVVKRWGEKVYVPICTRFFNYCYELLLGDRGKALATALTPLHYRGYFNVLAVKR